ncbi:MAG: transcription antitermination factor NusB [Bacilli bacterium]
MKRNNSRIKAMIVLYDYDLLGEKPRYDYIDKIIQEEESVDFDENFFNEIVDGVINNWDNINRIMSRNLKNWTFERMSIVDRNLIRIAIYEMLFTDTPHTIIINEILNLTHEYSELEDGLSSKFNNKLLDEIRKSFDGK